MLLNFSTRRAAMYVVQPPLGESVSSNPMCSLTILASARLLILRLLGG
jgi:hypothetical protein